MKKSPDKQDLKLKVLHVDDDTDFLAVFSLIYKKNFSITSTDSVSEAFSLIAENDFDAVVVDFDMPVTNGIEFLTKIKDVKPDLAVVFYTGQGNEEVAREAFLMGASDYFVKDIHGFAHREKLVNSVERAKRNQLTEKARKAGEERIKHLNNVLRAIRNVNKLITRETDTNKIIVRACEILVENRGFICAWIILVDEKGLYRKFAQAGMEQNSRILDECLKTGDYQCCFEMISEKSGVTVINQPIRQCCNCPLFDTSPLYGLLTARLEYNNELLGYMAVSVPSDFISDPEEQEIFLEVAGDVSYAIYHNRIRNEHEKATEELREREEVLNAITRTAHDFIFCKDLESKYTFINPAMARLFGAEAENILGRTPLELFGEEDSKIVNSVDKLVFEGKNVDEIKTLIIKNVPTIFHTVQVPLRDKNGNISGICGVVRDVTEREEARRKLQESEELFSVFMDNIPAGIFIKDENSKYIYVNSYLKKHFGAADWIGYDTFKAFPEKIAKKMVDDDNKVLNEGLQVVIDEIPLMEDTIHIYRTYKFPVFRKDKSPIIGGIAVNITAYEATEERFYALKKEIQLLLDNIDALIYKASMDFSTVSFLGNLEKLTGYTEDDFVSGRIHWKDIVSPKDDYSISPDDENRLRTQDGFILEKTYEIIHKNNSILKVKERISNICSRGGEILEIIGIISIIGSENKYISPGKRQEPSRPIGYVM